MTQLADQVYQILVELTKNEIGFAVGNEPSQWANGLRFSIYDVRSQTTMGGGGQQFDELIWKVEDALKAAEMPVAAVLKGKKLCMIDVDCRLKLSTLEEA